MMLAVGVGELDLGRRRQRQRRRIGGVEGDPAVAAADLAGARPRDLAGGEQLVEHRGLVVADPLPEHQRLDRRRGDRHARELVDHRRPARRLPTSCVDADLLPRGQEPGVGGRADRLDLRPQRGQRPSAQDLENVGVAPLFGVAGRR